MNLVSTFAIKNKSLNFRLNIKKIENSEFFILFSLIIIIIIYWVDLWNKITMLIGIAFGVDGRRVHSV